VDEPIEEVIQKTSATGRVGRWRGSP